MKLAKHDLVAALGLRYDHHSAQGLFEAACKRADLEDQDHYSVADVTAFRAALAKIGDRLQRVDERLDSLLSAAPANVPQAAAPMAATATPMPAKTEPAKLAQSPQAATPQPAVEPDEEPDQERARPVPAPSTERMTMRIVLTGIADLADGERLFVCGDRSELGSWDPERARPLHKDDEGWSTSIPPGDGTFKFLRRSADGTIIWEGGENREIGTAIEIETDWHV